jgi:hypothetical protein
MLVFPQLLTGSTAQYPITKQLSRRTVQSSMEDQTIVALPDQGSNFVRWQIAFHDLADQEATSLNAFFVTTQGSLRPFLFLDPTANLLLWSEDVTQSVWNQSGMGVESAVADPLGSSRASRVNNNTSSTQLLVQSSLIPGFVQTCFSVYLRASTPTTAALVRTAGAHSQSTAASVTSIWQRFYLSGKFSELVDPSCFGIRIPAGTSLELFGPQVDAQPLPSPYVLNAGNIGNVYPAARFDMKQLDVTATGPNRNACVVVIRCNLPVGDLL